MGSSSRMFSAPKRQAIASTSSEIEELQKGVTKHGVPRSILQGALSERMGGAERDAFPDLRGGEHGKGLR